LTTAFSISQECKGVSPGKKDPLAFYILADDMFAVGSKASVFNQTMLVYMFIYVHITHKMLLSFSHGQHDLTNKLKPKGLQSKRDQHLTHIPIFLMSFN